MNEQPNVQKRNIRFNWLDGAIILLIVLCVVGICFRYTIMDKLGMGNEMVQCRIVFTVSNVDSTLPDFLAKGNTLYLPSGEVAGQLEGVFDFSSITPAQAGSSTLVVAPASVYIDDGNGSIVLATYPNGTRIDATGAFNCRGSFSSEGYFSIEGQQIVSVGQQLTLRTDTVTLNITVTEIHNLED